jgi:hypothetical protein
METKAHRGNHAKIPAASTESPKQVRVFRRVRENERTIGQHDGCLEKVVADQAELRAHGAVSAAQSRPTHPDSTGVGSDRDQAVRNGGDRHVFGRCAASNDCGLSRGIDFDLPHARQVDDDAIVAQGSACKIVPTATHRERQGVLARRSYDNLNILAGFAESEERRTRFYCSVPYFPGAFVWNSILYRSSKTPKRGQS